MCGIFFALFKCSPSRINLEQIDFELLKNRGPDSFETLTLETPDGAFTLLAAVSVLSLRGSSSSQVTQQPLRHFGTGNVLLWNGEIFDSALIQIAPGENDGVRLLEKLSQASETSEIVEIMESVKGPYAFVFYQKKTSRIYFGRDRLGRRSLLINSNPSRQEDNSPSLILSSVQVKLVTDEFDELSANFLYKLDLSTKVEKIDAFQWRKLPNEPNKELNNLRFNLSELSVKDSILPFNENIDVVFDADKFESVTQEFFEKLKESVQRRVVNLPSFCKRCSKENFEEKKVKFDEGECEHAKLGVLFSGGVDSAVLAAMADLCLPKGQPIDLLNIAFEKVQKNNNPNQKSKIKFLEKTKKNNETADLSNFEVPDRISGLRCLQDLNPERKWNFVEINVTLEELRRERDARIRHLLYPHQTVLDDSIGCALWFASRGRGKVDAVEYESNAEVLLLGMGADEQLGGYARHRSRFERDGLRGLCDELKMEMGRISERNLGRDDRILSDHGKESRLPFLDEDVISFLNSVELVYKCDMKLGRGEGEKYLLRHLAATRLGLKFASTLQKRAIQFGSRVAKIENHKEKASDLCNRIARDLSFSEE